MGQQGVKVILSNDVTDNITFTILHLENVIDNSAITYGSVFPQPQASVELHAFHNVRRYNDIWFRLPLLVIDLMHD